jgi:putative transcriptional regulator
MNAVKPPPAPVDLTGKILIAMPGMGDPRFVHSVVYLCAHSAEGAMGLIINKPTQGLRMRDLLEHLSITQGPAMRDMPVHFGGPVEHGRGFVLHDDGYRSDIATLRVAAGFGMTATLDILEDIAQGRGPGRAILALGYAGWGPDQLESELAENGWLTCDADADLVFDTDDTGKWEAALSRLGVSSLTLSADAGHA